MQRTQVIIIGAGPTGLSLAVQLLRYNIEFIILEKNEKTTHLSKAIVVQARTLEIFQETGLAEKAIAWGRLTTAMNMYYKGKIKVSLDFAGLGQGLSSFPFALSLEQSKTEKLLVDYLSEKGKSINWNSGFTHFEQIEKGVIVHYKDGNGKEQTIEADYIVGCEGAHSQVRHEMGQSFEGDTVSKLFYVTDVILNSPVVNKDEMFIFLIKKGFILFFPMEGRGHYRVIGILPDHQEEKQIDFDSIKEEVVRQLVSPVNFEAVNWFSTYKVHSRKAGAFMNGRAFIAGDAAHIHTPAGGQGMNTGIQDAYNLAWKLAFTVHYNAGPILLESYNTERTGNAAHLLRTTDRAFEIMTGSTRFWNFFRLNVFPIIGKFISRNKTVNKRIFPLISMTSIAYPKSDLTIKSSVGKIKAGQRMHWFVFSNGKNIFDYLGDPGFKLLFFGTEVKDNSEQLKKIKIPLTWHVFIEIPTKLFKNGTNFYILLRPDNHISYIGRELDVVVKFLEKIIYP